MCSIEFDAFGFFLKTRLVILRCNSDREFYTFPEKAAYIGRSAPLWS
jgi:hypothetical protein